MTSGARRSVVAAAGVAVLGCILAACSLSPAPAEHTPRGPDAAAIVEWAPLPERQVAAGVTMRLADGDVPPTNRWYSGLVFGDAPQAVYPYPLAFRATGSSFSVELPKVTVTPTTIAASAGVGLMIETDATSFAATRHDPVSITLEYRDDTGPVGHLTIAEGWPVVGFVAERDTALSAPASLVAEGDGTWSVAAQGQTYGVVAPDADVSGSTLRLRAGASAQWFAVPEDSTIEAWADALGQPVTGVQTSFALDDTSATTRLAYTGSGSTILVAAPGQRDDASCALGTFATAYGTAIPCPGAELTSSVPRLTPTASFDLGDIDTPAGADAITRERITDALREDLAATPTLPSDTYGGGKAMARIGSLGLLAQSLGETELADQAAGRLWSELAEWMDPAGCEKREARCFVYDPVLRTVVGLTPSFGSEEANDHHFHYGYFLSAATALAALDPDRIDGMRPVISALAADIAAGDGESLPRLRHFDPYRGHSWASGLAPFADGNNQESTSEAVMAWNALALWADLVGDGALSEQATWMLSAEAYAARTLWLEPDLADIPNRDAFSHGMLSLMWGGKRDYATWFSAEPSAILGIQLIPVSPIGYAYLAENPESVRRNVAEAGGADAFTRALGDYVLAYAALGGADAASGAAEALDSLPDSAIDAGNARSLLLAWLAALPG
ncbi:MULTISPECIES: glycosyl hydrolase [unclassified Microbacterium]|uniref:glycosyl hydrolase n=1 Tax=unclassified Microbacterium TaxID=2609290 RepID=UPI000C2C7A3B|nr:MULTISPECIES: glycosyl hydrolase [unclassified Microbacterium]